MTNYLITSVTSRNLFTGFCTPF